LGLQFFTGSHSPLVLFVSGEFSKAEQSAEPEENALRRACASDHCCLSRTLLYIASIDSSHSFLPVQLNQKAAITLIKGCTMTWSDLGILDFAGYMPPQKIDAKRIHSLANASGFYTFTCFLLCISTDV